MKLFSNIYVAITTLLISITVLSFAIFNFQLSKVSDNDTIKEIVINPGSIDQIATTLYENNLIKDTLSFKIYVRLTKNNSLKAATYNLSENMGVRKIVNILASNKGINTNEISITLKEGINMRTLASVIEESTNNSSNDLYNTLKDKEYLTNLINKYWFLENTILDDKIYYSLEGYLYPDTYYFASKDVKVQEIIEKVLDEMEKKITPYKDKIESHQMTFHEILTLASIVELEGVTEEDRKNIASVFINRINSNMTLGSDVTTYYGAKINMGDRDLYANELNSCNDYNTRCATFKGLPISPIANPTLESITAVIEPVSTNYYYFVADKNRKVYFSQNINEHNNTIYRLKTNGLWYEY